MCKAVALWIADRSEQALRLVQHSLDELPSLWLTGWDNAISIHLRKVCRCQQEDHQRIMNWLFHCIQSALLQYLVPFFRDIVLGWQQMRKSSKRRGWNSQAAADTPLLPRTGPHSTLRCSGAGTVDADSVGGVKEQERAQMSESLNNEGFLLKLCWIMSQVSTNDMRAFKKCQS